jgi:hypothetical protein
LKTALGRTPPLDIREVFVGVPLDKRGALVKVETELIRFGVWVQLTVKIRRAHGGCLGTRRRRRTWTAAISHGEALNSH